MNGAEEPQAEGGRVGIYIMSSLMHRARAASRSPGPSLAGVILSAFSVEAFVNAFLHATSQLSLGALDRNEPLRVLAATVTVNGLLEVNDRTLLRRKIEMIAGALKAEPHPFGRDPFQSLGWLIEARNLLAHGRLEHIELAPERMIAVTYAKLIDEVSRRAGLPPPHTIGLPIVVEVLENPRVAEWAYGVAYRTATDIVAWLPASPIREELADQIGLAPPFRPAR